MRIICILWILCVGCNALRLADLFDMPCPELALRRAVGLPELPLTVNPHLQRFLLDAAPRCRKNTWSMVERMREAESRETELAEIIVARAVGPSAFELLKAAIQAYFGMGDRLDTFRGADDEVNQVVEAAKLLMPNSLQFPTWSVSDLEAHLSPASPTKIMHELAAREVLVEKLLAYLPVPKESGPDQPHPAVLPVQGQLQLLFDKSEAVTPRMLILAAKIYTLLPESSQGQLMENAREHHPFMLPVLFSKITEISSTRALERTNQKNKMEGVLKCKELGSLSSDIQCICAQMYLSFGNLMAKALAAAAAALTAGGSSHPLADLDQLYHIVLLEGLLKAKLPPKIQEYATALMNAPGAVRELYPAQYIADRMYSLAMMGASPLERNLRPSILKVAIDRSALMRAHHDFENTALWSWHKVKPLLDNSLLSTPHLSYTSAFPAFTARCFKFIVDRVNNMGRLLQLVRTKPSSLGTSDGRTTLQRTIATGSPMSRIIVLEDQFVHLPALPYSLPSRLRDLSVKPLLTEARRVVQAEYKGITDQELPANYIRYPSMMVTGTLEWLQGEKIKDTRLNRQLAFEIVRNGNTMQDIRFSILSDQLLMLGLTAGPHSLPPYKEPYPLSWFGTWPSSLAFRDIFESHSWQRTIFASRPHPSQQHSSQQYWMKFLARAMAEYYACKEGRLHREYAQRGAGMTLSQFTEAPENQRLIQHRDSIVAGLSDGRYLRVATAGQFNCLVAKELDERWQGTRNVDFALPCSQSYAAKIELNDRQAAEPDVLPSLALQYRNQSRELASLRRDLWKRVFENVTRDTLLEALEEVPIELADAILEIPLQSDLWEIMPATLQALRGTDPAAKQKKVFDMAVSRSAPLTPWVAFAALEINYAGEDEPTLRKHFEDVASRFLDSLADPMVRHRGIRALRETVYKYFVRYPGWKKPPVVVRGEARAAQTDERMAPIRLAMSLRFLEGMSDEEMLTESGGKEALSYMTQGATLAISKHWDKYLRHFRDNKDMMRPILGKMETDSHWLKMLSNVKFEEAELLLLKLADALAGNVGSLCELLRRRFEKPADCSPNSDFFQAVRLLAVLDLDAPNVCLEAKYEAFKKLGVACDVLSSQSKDPLEKLRFFKLEISPLKPPEPQPRGPRRTGPSRPLPTTDTSQVEPAPMEEVVVVEKMWPARTKRTLNAALFVLFTGESHRIDRIKTALSARTLGEDTARFMTICKESGLRSGPRASMQVQLKGLQAFANRIDTVAGTTIDTYIRIIPADVPIIPLDRVHVAKERRLLLEPLEQSRAQSLQEEFGHLRTLLDSTQAAALALVGIEKTPALPAEFEASMAKRYQQMVDNIEDDTFRSLLDQSRTYSERSDEDIMRMKLAGPGRMANPLSRYLGQETLWQLIFRLPRKRKYASMEERKLAISGALLSQGVPEALIEDGVQEYPGLYHGRAAKGASTGGFGGPPPGPGSIPPGPGGIPPGPGGIPPGPGSIPPGPIGVPPGPTGSPPGS